MIFALRGLSLKVFSDQTNMKSDLNTNYTSRLGLEGSRLKNSIY